MGKSGSMRWVGIHVFHNIAVFPIATQRGNLLSDTNINQMDAFYLFHSKPLVSNGYN